MPLSKRTPNANTMADQLWNRWNQLHYIATRMADEQCVRGHARSCVVALSCVGRDALGGAFGNAPWPSTYAEDRFVDAVGFRRGHDNDSTPTYDESEFAASYDAFAEETSNGILEERVRTACAVASQCARVLDGTDTTRRGFRSKTV
ncbi:hypothetical protein RI054_30g121510 [Pseudoscourfieldia marina]